MRNEHERGFGRVVLTMDTCVKNWLVSQALNLAISDYCPATIAGHHAYAGGLFQHTLEVIQLAKQPSSFSSDLDLSVIEIGAAFHDLGKQWIYTKTKDGWACLEDYDKQEHIRQSEIIFLSRCKDLGGTNIISKEEIEHIVHIIRSHHGSLEMGSIEAPATKEAWAVHLADAMSAFCLGNCLFRPESFKEVLKF